MDDLFFHSASSRVRDDAKKARLLNVRVSICAPSGAGFTISTASVLLACGGVLCLLSVPRKRQANEERQKATVQHWASTVGLSAFPSYSQ